MGSFEFFVPCSRSSIHQGLSLWTAHEHHRPSGYGVLLRQNNVPVATNVVELVMESGEQRFIGRDGASFENGERVWVRDSGLETRPQVLLDHAQNLGFNILQATRKSDGKVVWIVGILNDWLRDHLAQVDYDIDVITQSEGNLGGAASFFRKVTPGELVNAVVHNAGQFRLTTIGGRSTGVPAVSLDYNEYWFSADEESRHSGVSSCDRQSAA